MNFSEKELNKILLKDTIQDFVDVFKMCNEPLIGSYFAETWASLVSFIINDESVLGNLGYNFNYVISYILTHPIKTNNNASNYIESTDEYVKLKELYDVYISEIAKLIKSFGDMDIYDHCLIYTILLKNGFLSLNRSFLYHRYDYDCDQRSILGARITSGYGVCRHETFNLLDVFDKLGYQNAYIMCKANLHNSKFKNYPKLFSFIKKESHGLGIVADDNEHIIIDPTWESIGAYFKKENIIKARKFWDNENDLLYYMNYDKSKRNDVNYFNKLESILKKGNYLQKHSADETKIKFEKAKQIICENYEYLEQWNKYYEELMREISLLDKTLSCYKDKEIVRKLSRKGE